MFIRYIISLDAILSFAVLFAGNAQDKLYDNAFPFGDVKLLESPFKEAMDLNTTVLLKYTVDRLLSSCLTDAGLAPKAADYTTGGAWAGQVTAVMDTYHDKRAVDHHRIAAGSDRNGVLFSLDGRSVGTIMHDKVITGKSARSVQIIRYDHTCLKRAF